MIGGEAARRQLVLELGHRPALGREDFLVADSNRDAVALIDAWPDWPAGTAMLTGPAGSGKTHLAEVWRGASGARRVEAAKLEEASVPALIGDGAPQSPLVPALVVEDVDRLPVQAEPALFHLLNMASESGAFLLLTARAAPARLQVSLPDLASRLKALYTVAVAAPDDGLLGAVLVKLFDDRQLRVPEAVVPFLVARMERSVDAARRLVAALDRASLAGKRPVTVPLAAEILNNNGAL